jgi:hypothetical protein
MCAAIPIHGTKPRDYFFTQVTTCSMNWQGVKLILEAKIQQAFISYN